MTSAAFPPPPFDPPAGDQPAIRPGRPTGPPLRRSSTDRMVGGVCGGLAQHVGIDALLWRIGFVALTLAGGSGILVYLALWVLMEPAPRAPHEPVSAAERLAERAHDAVSGAVSGAVPGAAGTRRQD